MKLRNLSTAHKQLILCVIISGSVFSSFIVGWVATNSVTLSRPRWNIPVLLLSNESFTIEAQTNTPLTSVGDFRAEITSEFGTFQLLVDSITQNMDSIKAVVHFPNTVTKDVLYDLAISVGGLEDEQQHAVKVLSSYKTEFKIIVWCDTHMETTSIRTYALIKDMIDQANLINPEFILLCGDIVETGLNSEYQLMHDQCMRLTVPIFAGTGNHDHQDMTEYEKWCQYFNFTFDYGSAYHFTYIDTGINFDGLRDGGFDWLQSDLAAHAGTPVRIVAGHAAPYDFENTDPVSANNNFERYQDAFINLLSRYNVCAYFHGHLHTDRITYGNFTTINGTVYVNPIPSNWSTTATRYIQTASGKSDGAYRVVSFKDNRIINDTALVNMTTGVRDQKASLRPVYDWSVASQQPWPSPLVQNLQALTNVSSANNESAPAVHAIDCNVTNRFSQEYFDNLTVSFNLVSATQPTLLHNIWSNETIAIKGFEALQRTDLSWVVKLQFYSKPNSTIEIKAWGS